MSQHAEQTIADGARRLLVMTAFVMSAVILSSARRKVACRAIQASIEQSVLPAEQETRSRS